MKPLVAQDPEILGGKPIIVGTRMSVESILELLSSGLTTQEILKEYPFLTKGQVQAAIVFATKIVAKEESYVFDKARMTANEISSRR